MMDKKTPTVPLERKKPPCIFGATYKMLRCNKYNILENKTLNWHVSTPLNLSIFWQDIFHYLL
jgi:hypothetical protein